jgi:D-alanine-D-alanine ligase
VSLYQPIKAHFFLRRYPKAVTTGPRIVLVTGEDGPDKLHVYAPVYTVYKTLRPYFNVELSVHASFNARHVRRIVQMRPDLVLLSSGIGRWQQLLEQYQVPLMGSSSHTCKLCYDKVAAKQMVRSLAITTMPWVVVRKGESIEGIPEQLRFPVVVKPQCGGSSEGVSKVASPKDLRKAIGRALRWDTEAVVEEYATGREYTCTVYGNENPETLPLNRKIMPFERAEMEASGERVFRSRFPVMCDEPFVAAIHARSKDIYTSFQCRDMIRIDWKYDHATQALCFLEINTLPWIGRTGGNIEACARAAGSSYEEFIVRLFRDSLQRHRRL